MIYNSIFLFLIILTMLEKNIQKNKRIYFVFKIVITLILILFCGFRTGVGFDDHNYFLIFNNTPNILELKLNDIFLFKQEIGYFVLNLIIKSTFNSARILLLTITSITFIFLYKYISYFSNYYFLPITFYYARYYFLRDFNQIRYSLAISIVLYASIFLFQNQKKKYFFWVIFGSLFHKSILIALSFPVMIYFKEKNKKIRYKICLYLYFILLAKVINLKLILIKTFSGYIPEAYLTGEYSKRGGYIYILFSIFFLICLDIFIDKNKRINSKYFYLKNQFIYSLLVNFLFLSFGDLGGRLSSIFATSEIILLERVREKIKIKALAQIIIIVFLIFLYKINFIDRLSKVYIPYKSTLEYEI